MGKGIPWAERSWTPIVGMKIRYRAHMRRSSDHDPNTTGEILSVLEGDVLRVRTTNANGTRTVSLASKTWKAHWEPVSKSPSTVVISSLTEEDVRRIVREELGQFARKTESATREWLDSIFNAL